MSVRVFIYCCLVVLATVVVQGCRTSVGKRKLEDGGYLATADTGSCARSVSLENIGNLRVGDTAKQVDATVGLMMMDASPLPVGWVPASSGGAYLLLFYDFRSPMEEIEADIENRAASSIHLTGVYYVRSSTNGYFLIPDDLKGKNREWIVSHWPGAVGIPHLDTPPNRETQ